MKSYQNWEIFGSIIFCIATKFVYSLIKVITLSMSHKKRPTLSSIPENNEIENDVEPQKKWVPKKKHEVLKAKYKCLKKLFQIYDANVIGMLPEPHGNGDGYHMRDDGDDIEKHTRKKRKPHKIKTDAYAGTSEIFSCVTERIEEKCPIANAVLRDLKMTQCSCTSLPFNSINSTSSKINVSTQESRHNLSVYLPNSENCSVRNYECPQTPNRQYVPYLVLNEKRKPRFQSFWHRLFGIKCERTPRNCAVAENYICTASDNNMLHREKRRRRGLRFRRFRKAKRIQSEGDLNNFKSPVILSYMQSIQKNCLMDTTPRQCPIIGCKMMFYGIINYNDHLNMCHFTERKFICHYCHEGFETEYDKAVHENEHIGISKLNNTILESVVSTARQSQIASNTQTEPEQLHKFDDTEDKLNKIVSFFDKIADTEQILSEIKKTRCSDSNLISSTTKTNCTTNSSESSANSGTDKRTMSCVNLQDRQPPTPTVTSCDNTSVRQKTATMVDSDLNATLNGPIKCHICGENFDYRRQLSLHVDLEHRVHDKFSKFHSCAGIVNSTAKNSPRVEVTSDSNEEIEQGSELHNCITSTTLTHDFAEGEVTRRKSEESLGCSPSTNIVYYTSTDSLNKKPSTINNFVQKVRSYKWEPGTKIIRV